MRKHTDIESGRDMGRIWRVVETGQAGRPAAGKGRKGGKVSLAPASARALVEELASLNSWRRDTAFRLLIERGGPEAAKHLERGLTGLESPAALASRLSLLSLQGALDESRLLIGLRSPNPGVREAALKLTEPRLGVSTNLQAQVLQLADDADARVRFQCALALGELGREPTLSGQWLRALARIALRDNGDKWTRAAVLSSATGRERDLLATVLRDRSVANPSASAVLSDLGRLLSRSLPSTEQPALLRETLFDTTLDFDAMTALWTGFAEARPETLQPLASAAGSDTEKRLQEWFVEAKRLAGDGSVPLARRLLAAKLLASAEAPTNNPVLLECLRPIEPIELQSVAVRALTQPRNVSGVLALLAPNRWHGFAPGLRSTVLGAVLNRPEHHAALLDALESGAVPVSAVDSSRREPLKKSKIESIRQRAEKLFGTAASGDRQNAFEAARACLALQPVPRNGLEVFRRLCASCHRLDRDGVAVGPDLFDIRNQPKESILLHIVLPEQEVAPNFASYLCETKDGRTLSGLIAAETATTVTLRQAQGLEEVISRDDIAVLTASELSLMPQELEKGMTVQEMADLLAYLKGE
jgi:putative heme-binding domain-containing protein